MKALLLDTHVWIWLIEGLPSLAKKHRDLINQTAEHTQVCIAAISQWEISMLVMKQRIRINKPVLTWIEETLALPAMALKPLTAEIAADSCQLPGDFHGDPADRLIISTARIHDLTLLTHDEKLIEYSKNKHVSVLAV